MQEDLNSLLRVLLESKIDFIIVGGFAAVVHGSSHVTKDLDIAMALNAESIGKLRVALHDLNPKHRMNPSHKASFLDEPKALDRVENIYLETNCGILDIISDVPGLDPYANLRERALEVNLFGHPCKVLSLDDLIEVKRSLGRNKDKIVLEELLKIKTQEEL